MPESTAKILPGRAPAAILGKISSRALTFAAAFALKRAASPCGEAQVAELVDAQVSGTCGREAV